VAVSGRRIAGNRCHHCCSVRCVHLDWYRARNVMRACDACVIAISSARVQLVLPVEARRHTRQHVPRQHVPRGLDHGRHAGLHRTRHHSRMPPAQVCLSFEADAIMQSWPLRTISVCVWNCDQINPSLSFCICCFACLSSQVSPSSSCGVVRRCLLFVH
jgi:hypothetical protein